MFIQYYSGFGVLLLLIHQKSEIALHRRSIKQCGNLASTRNSKLL
jgi:hypothetical protein